MSGKSKEVFFRAKSILDTKTKIFVVLWSLTFRWILYILPGRFSFLKSFLLRLFGSDVGCGCLIMHRVNVLMPWNLRLGNYVTIGAGVWVYNYSLVDISDRSVISQGVSLCTGSHDYNDSLFPLVHSPIRIEKDVWLAADVFICPGVSVAEGSVVAARGVVGASILTAWGVWAGNPVKRVAERVLR
jgi:putative colanic acid biosynthesis acetyltransferase WcaF